MTDNNHASIEQDAKGIRFNRLHLDDEAFYRFTHQDECGPFVFDLQKDIADEHKHKYAPAFDFPDEETRLNGFDPSQEIPIEADSEYKPKFRTLTQMRRDYPDRKPECIGGLLRLGETMFATAGTKQKKSWLFMSLAVSKVYGLDWLGRFPMKPGKALMLDMELQEEELTSRADLVARALLNERSDCDGLVLESLRGQVPTLHGLGRIIEQAGKDFDLIFVDCMYRIRGFNESDPENVKEAFNMFDNFAASAEASFGVVHHNSKGDQGSKTITDLGSGTGVLTRAPDTIIGIRPHEEDDYSVLEFVRRSGPDPEPFAAQFRFPLWHADDEVEPIVKQPLGRGDLKQQSRDEAGKADIVKSLHRGNQSKTSVRKDLGFNTDRINRLFRQLLDEDRIHVTGTGEHPINKQPFDLYAVKPQSEQGADLNSEF